MPPQTYPMQFNQQMDRNSNFSQSQGNNQNYTDIYGNPYPNQSYPPQRPVIQSVAPVNDPTMKINVQPTYILGKMIENEKDVVAGEVPNDGSYGTYIQRDLKRIYMKTWGGNGLIDTKVFELVDPGNQNMDGAQVDPTMQMILERLDNIERMVKNNRSFKSNKPNYKKSTYQEKGEDVNA